MHCRYWLFLLLFVFGTGRTWGQFLPDTSFTRSLIANEQLSSFLEEKGWIDEPEAWLPESLSQLYGNLPKPEKKKAELKGALNTQTYFEITDQSDYRLYNYLSMEQQFTIAGLPFSIHGGLVADKKRIDPALSTISVHFQYQTFADVLRKKYAPLKKFSELFDSDNNPLGMNQVSVSILKKEIQYSMYRRVVNHPDYHAYRLSLEQQKDSLIQVKADSSVAYQKTMEALALMDSVGQRYKALMKFRTQLQHSARQEVNEQVEKANNQFEKLADSESLRQYVLSRSGSGLKEKLFTLTKHFDIGIFSLAGSEFTLQNTSLNGIYYALETGNIFGELAYGSRSFDNSYLSASGGFPYLNRAYGRRFFYSSAGVGDLARSYLKLSVLRAREGGDVGNNALIYPKKNQLFALSNRSFLTTNLNVQWEAAVSELELPATTTIEPQEERAISERLAYSVNVGWQTTNRSLSIYSGYFSVGPRYYTLGNPFLITNRRGINLGLQGRLLDGKIRFDGTLNYGLPIDKTITGFSSATEWQLRGSLSFSPNKKWSITGSAMPNIFSQQVENREDYRIKNTIYNIQTIYQGKFLGLHAMTVANFTNLRTDFEIPDSLRVDNAHYVFLQEDIFLSARQSISGQLMLGGDQISVHALPDDYQVQLSYRNQGNKSGFVLGLQVLKNRLYPDTRYGIQFGGHLKILTRFSIQFNAIYRRSLEPGIAVAKYQLLGSSSLRFAF